MLAQGDTLQSCFGCTLIELNRFLTMRVILILLLFIVSNQALHGQFTINGHVSDDMSKPLPAAHIELINTQYLQATDLNGEFSFRNLKPGDYQLLISYLGFKDTLVKVQLDQNIELRIQLSPEPYVVDGIVVNATRASEYYPTAYSEMDREDLEKINLGQDMPFLLESLPSTVATSDAGAGIGYTGIRIRGSDASRINVTINGVPLNDPESQGTFWVDIPDFVSSVDHVQVQRGVGFSTNGVGAFGATINFKTTGIHTKPYGNVSASFGSFNSSRLSASIGTGLIGGHFSFDGRLSNIYSNGYVDRATTDMQSYYLSGTYLGKSTTLKLITFSGKEETYQAWWGVPEELLNSDRTFNYYTYDNEIDRYQQTHYQAHIIQKLGKKALLNASAFYIKGKGFFEQFREVDDFSDYGLEYPVIGGDTVQYSDIIRRRWLDNDFYGINVNTEIQWSEKSQSILGLGWSNYEGAHFGEIIWSEIAVNHDIRHRYYENMGKKSDFNIFFKTYYTVNNQLTVFADLQLRNVDYTVNGIDNDLRVLKVDTSYRFFNPKAGFNFTANAHHGFYTYFGIGHREPTRNDFIDANEGVIPVPESMINLELGYKYQSSAVSAEVNFYLMNYNNQLVLTGALNDVGTPIRANAAKSHRVGVEVQAGWQISRKIKLNSNLTVSSSKILDYQETVYIYDTDFNYLGSEIIKHGNTNISFSPNLIAAGSLIYEPVHSLYIALEAKYVGNQFLDNTSNTNRQINAYFLNNLTLNYSIHPKWMDAIILKARFNNLFNVMYESNGYTYGWFYDNTDESNRDYYNFYYPQAGFNVMFGVDLKF